jgi:hypothetical protein
MLVRIDKALSIFEKLYPRYVALFIFNQSSAHALYEEDVLRAFEINKTNKDNQRKQKDTIIPMNNSYPEYCSKP